MILIQIILIVSFVALMAYFLFNPQNLKIQAWKKVLGVFFLLTAVLFILYPESSNFIANKLGVVRGADLLLYMLTLAFIFVSISSYIKSKQEHNNVVILARKIAILEANQRQNKNVNK
jgi:small membrane protein